MKLTKKAIEYFIFAFFCSSALALPFIAGTQSYPLAVVEGNSMYPNLQNGDLVYYGRISPQRVPNGTVIVFVQGETGMPLLDGLVKPVVIHRVIGQVVQADGTVCYETKGDNNDYNDPALVRQDHILGAMGQNIPKIGLFLLFVKSPQGLIATVGIIAISYLSIHEAKRKYDKKKENFLGALAQKTLNGELSNEAFKKFELAIKYSDSIKDNQINDFSSSILVDWLKKGCLDQKWMLEATECQTCSNHAFSIKPEKEDGLIFCSKCGTKWITSRTKVARKIKEIGKNFDFLFLESVDETLSSLGTPSKTKVYFHLEKSFAVKKHEIPNRANDLSVALKRMFGVGANHLEKSIMKKISQKTKIDSDWSSGSNDALRMTFAEYVESLKRNLEAMSISENSRILINRM